MRGRNIAFALIIFGTSLFLFTRGLELYGFEYRDDEIFYVKSTQEMITTNHYLAPSYFGEHRFQKPILYYWMILLSYKFFGIGWVGARMVAALFGALTVLLTWKMAEELCDKKIAWMSAVILATIPLFFRHAKNAVPDMPLTFCIVSAMYFGIKLWREPKALYSALFFISCGVGFMIKGYAALVIPLGTFLLYACWTKQTRHLKSFRWGWGLLILAVLILPWFIYMFKQYGSVYIQYIWVDEIKSRIMNRPGNVVIVKSSEFLSHIFFYIRNIFVYFMPWSLWGVAAIPFAFTNRKMEQNTFLHNKFLLSWIIVTIMFFSSLYFVINHYMLAIATPFAILTAVFLSYYWKPATVLFSNRLVIFLLFAGLLVFSFLLVFFMKYNPLWFVLLLAIGWRLSIWIKQSSHMLRGALVLGCFLLFFYAQSPLLSKAGLTVHTSLQRFAQTIQESKKRPRAIGVGSADLHGKEFQIYFDEPVEETAYKQLDGNSDNLMRFLNKEETVFCLIKREEFERLLRDYKMAFPLTLMQEEYVLRRRFNLNGGFVLALLKFDREAVKNYLMETVVLVRKDPPHA